MKSMYQMISKGCLMGYFIMVRHIPEQEAQSQGTNNLAKNHPKMKQKALVEINSVETPFNLQNGEYCFICCTCMSVCVACWGLRAKYCDNVYCKYTRQSGANGIQSLDSPKSTSTGQSFKSTLHPKGTKLAESTNCVYNSLTKCPVCPQARTTKSLSQLRIKK